MLPSQQCQMSRWERAGWSLGGSGRGTRSSRQRLPAQPQVKEGMTMQVVPPSLFSVAHVVCFVHRDQRTRTLNPVIPREALLDIISRASPQRAYQRIAINHNVHWTGVVSDCDGSNIACPTNLQTSSNDTIPVLLRISARVSRARQLPPMLQQCASRDVLSRGASPRPGHAFARWRRARALCPSAGGGQIGGASGTPVRAACGAGGDGPAWSRG